MQENKYFAFISYSHFDKKKAKILHEKIENFRIPKNITNEGNNKLPEKIKPVFLDETVSNFGKLETILKKELEDSRYLIVLCSPSAAQSHYVNSEVEYFIKLGRENRIIPIIIEGTPNPKTALEKQCYPASLDKSILGINFSKNKNSKDFVKIVTSLLDLKFDWFWDREKRRQSKRRNILYLLLFIFSTLLLGISFSTWNYYKMTTKYYSDYVDRFAIPYGLIELTKEEMLKRNSCFEFKYKQNRLRSVTLINSDGTPLFYSEVTKENRPVRQNLIYNENGKLVEIDFLNNLGTVLCSYKYSGDKMLEVDIKSRNGIAAYSQSTLSNLGTIYMSEFTKKSKNKVTHFSLKRNQKGEITGITFKYGDREIINDLSGICSYKFKLDADGRILEKHYLDKKNKLIRDKIGVSIIKYSYDIFGNIASVQFCSKSDKLILNNNLFAKAIFKSNNYGNIILNSYFDENGKSTIIKGGYANEEFEYDNRGHLIKATFLDTNKKICYNKSGYAIRRFTYNKVGLQEEISVQDLNDQLCYNLGGYAKRKTSYNKNNFPVKSEYFGVNGEHCFNEDSISIFTVKYNKLGLINEIRYLDKDGNPCNSIENISITKTKYDENDNQVYVEYFDKSENPCILKQYNDRGEIGYSKTKLHYDTNGNNDIIEYKDTIGKPFLKNENYNSIVINYDDFGRIVSSSLFKISNSFYKKVIGKEGYHKSEIKYYSNGKKLINYYYDLNGDLVTNIHGFAIKEMIFDDYGNLIRESYFNKDGLLSPLDNYNYSYCNLEYDQRGNITQITNYDINQNLTYYNDGDMIGFAKCFYKYDKRDNLIQKRYYFLNQNNLIDYSYCEELTIKYDTKDRPIFYRWLDSNGKTIKTKGGYSSWEKIYDKKWNVIKVLNHK